MQLPPFPLEDNIAAIFEDLLDTDFEPTGLTREHYLDLAEHTVRCCLHWQRDDGVVINPVVGRETSTSTARFIGAVAGCIWGGRCEDLIENCARAMDYCCAVMADERQPEEIFSGPEFFTKELMYGWFALKGKVDEGRHQRWSRQLSSFHPWVRYPSWHHRKDSNFPIYAVCGEQLRIHAGLADTTEDIDRVLDNQFKLISPCGMYRDPHDPFTYDLTDRQQLGMLPYFGYEGRHAGWIDEATRRGGLTQLLFTSVTGQMPFGGRSNQYHHMEAMAATICELEARRYKNSRPEYAGAFKRAARMAAASVSSWILDYDPPFLMKNRFPGDARHGDSGYDSSPYSAYMFLMASIFGTAYQMADEEIEESAAPVDRGGYVMQLWPAFHRTFATCGDYHIEIDNRGQPTHDATGLGRVHKRGMRPETALSAPIPANPAVQMSIEPSADYVAIGPAVKWGVKTAPLAGMAASTNCGGIFSADLTVISETPDRVEFAITYRGDLLGADTITEAYELTADGLVITPSAQGGELTEFRVPLLVTDGEAESEITVLDDGFEVTYEGASSRIPAENPADLKMTLADEEVPGTTGIFRVATFAGDVQARRFHLVLTSATQG
ncbi:MAG: hypothetical protein R6V19_14040 [Armatimonadota bacterium]